MLKRVDSDLIKNVVFHAPPLEEELMKELLRQKVQSLVTAKKTATFDSLMGCMKGWMDDDFMEFLKEIRQWDELGTSFWRNNNLELDN